MKKFACTVISCICLGISAAEPIFQMDFDGNVEPVKASSGTAVSIGTPVRYKPGLRGQALLIGTDDQGQRHGLTCSRRGNLHWSKGTLSFWVRPVNWDGADNGFFASFFNAGNSKNSFLVYKYHEGDSLFHMRGPAGKWTRCSVGLKTWKRGEWHHLVCTWSGKKQKLFCDGRLFSDLALKTPQPDSGVSRFIIGETSSSMLLHGKGRLSLMDEFKIFDTVLPLDEIRKLYNAEKTATLPSQMITLGKYRDAFSGIGMSAVSDNEIALPKARYMLGRDDHSLYISLRESTLENSSVEVIFRIPGSRKDRIIPMAEKAPGSFSAVIPLTGLSQLSAGKVLLFNIRSGKYDLNGFSQLIFQDDAPRINFHEAFDLKAAVYSVRAEHADGITLEIEGNTGEQYGIFRRTGSLSEKNYFTRHPLKKWQTVVFRFVKNGKVMDRLEYTVRL